VQAEVLLAVILLTALVSAVLAMRRKRRMLARQFNSEWGAAKVVRETDEDAMAGIRQCYLDMRPAQTASAWVDEITWNDLDMDAVYHRLNRTQSGAGEETLYRMLHAIDVDGETLTKRDRWMRVLTDNDASRAALQKRLRALGREHEHGAFAYLRKPEASRPAYAWVYFVLAVLPFVFLALGLFNPYLFLGILGSFFLNTAVYYRSKRFWMRELAAIRHLAGVLGAARRMRRSLPAGMEDGAAELAALCDTLRPLARWNGLLYMQRVNEFDFITDYLRIAFQLDMISLIRLGGFIKKHADDAARIYLLVGEIDACIALASVRKSLPRYAVPEFWGGKHVLAEGVAHPLIKNPVLNTMDWNRNVLVTGSNASGKSTFVKAIALNAVLAQSIFTCWAERFRMPRAQVLSSMAIRDNVQGGESYFIVEIKSLKRILSALREDQPTLCFIDEILRGTNTVERIAASVSLLSYLNGQNALCIAATHDIELTRLLPDYRQVHFREEITPQGMVFPYKLCEGVSDTRNAIRLLEQMGFPKRVIEDADSMAAEDSKKQDAER
jgi:hypothetical protein